MKDPLVSVIVPAWNAERTLGETLRSVAAQTYKKLEILIVDDGSTDSTALVAKNFCEQEPRARLIAHENGGVAAARNSAIAEANGEWIAPIDADDLWHPTKIERQIDVALAARAKPGFVYCWHRLIDSDSLVTASGPHVSLSGNAFAQLAYLNVVENGSALLLSRDAVMEVGGYDESLRAAAAQGCEDVMIQLQIARRHPIAVVPEYLVGHRRHGENMSRDFDQMVRSWRLVYAHVTNADPLPRPVVRWVDGKCALDIAERRAVEGKLLDSLPQLASAFALDPLRCGTTIAYRAIRSVKRRISRRPSTAQMPSFYEIEPDAELIGDPFAIPFLTAWMDRLNASRLRRLAVSDTTQL